MTSFEVVEGQQPPMTTNIEVLVDSGTSQLFLPMKLVREYYLQVENATYTQGRWQMPCRSMLPTIRFGLQGGFFGSVTMKDLVPWAVVGKPINSMEVDEENLCIGRLQEIEKGGYAIFGLPVFSSHFLVFDLQGERIGFAKSFDPDAEHRYYI